MEMWLITITITFTITITIQWGKKWDLTSIIVKRTKVEIYFESFLNLQFYLKLQNSYIINWKLLKRYHDEVGHPIIVQNYSRNEKHKKNIFSFYLLNTKTPFLSLSLHSVYAVVSIRKWENNPLVLWAWYKCIKHTPGPTLDQPQIFRAVFLLWSAEIKANILREMHQTSVEQHNLTISEIKFAVRWN